MLSQNLTEKVAQHSDTTYSAVKGLGYDETNKKLGLVISQGGADTVIPFSGGDLSFVAGSYGVLYPAGFAEDTTTFSIYTDSKYCYIISGSLNYRDSAIRIDTYVIHEGQIVLHNGPGIGSTTFSVTVSGNTVTLKDTNTSLYVSWVLVRVDVG